MIILIGSEDLSFSERFKQITIQFPDMGFTSNESDSRQRRWTSGKSLSGVIWHGFFASLLCSASKENHRVQLLHKNWLWRVAPRSLNEINRRFTAQTGEKQRTKREIVCNRDNPAGLIGSVATAKCRFDSYLSCQTLMRPRHPVGLGDGSMPKIREYPDKSQPIAKRLAVFIPLPRLLSTGA